MMAFPFPKDLLNPPKIGFVLAKIARFTTDSQIPFQTNHGPESIPHRVHGTNEEDRHFRRTPDAKATLSVHPAKRSGSVMLCAASYGDFWFAQPAHSDPAPTIVAVHASRCSSIPEPRTCRPELYESAITPVGIGRMPTRPLSVYRSYQPENRRWRRLPPSSTRRRAMTSKVRAETHYGWIVVCQRRSSDRCCVLR
jgi:hypothetical protein